MALFNLAPSDSVLKVGLIGLGPHAIENLIPSLQTSENFVLTAVSSRNIEKAKEWAHKFSCSSITNRWQDVISSSKIDVVVVSGPPALHEEVLWSCLDSMKPVFVEKPPAQNLDGLNKLVYQYGAKGLKHFVGYNFRFADAFLQVQTEQREPACMQINMHSNKPHVKMWNSESVFESYLYAVGIHAIEFATHSFGRVQDIDFHIQFLNQSKFILNLSIKFQKGKHAQLCLSNCKPKFEMNTNFFYTDGHSININNLRTQTSHVVQNGQKMLSTLEPSGLKGGYTANGYRNELDRFASEIIGNQTPQSPLYKSVPVYQIIDELKNFSKRNK